MREGEHDLRSVEVEVLRLSVAAVLACSCGPRPPVSDHSYPPSPRDEIEELSAQIAESRREAGLPLEPACERVVTFAPIDGTKSGCGAPKLSRAETCEIGDAICDNAEQICVVASEFSNRWAHGKCESAMASCSELSRSCTSRVTR